MAVWIFSDDLGGTIGTDLDILVSRSTDGGLTWTDPASLDNNATYDSGRDETPEIETDGLGNWLVVWESEDTLGCTIGTDRDILLARSTDNGASWSDAAPLNNNAPIDSGNDYGPQLTTDGQGHWVAVWHSYEILEGTIGTDADILVARSLDVGMTWTAPEPLNSDAATDDFTDRSAGLATDGLGNWVAVWRGGDWYAEDLEVARSTNNGVSWTIPALLASEAYPEWPRVATDKQETWYTVWQRNSGLRRVFLSRSVNNGLAWSEKTGLRSYSCSDHDGSPHLATKGQGTWLVTWHSTNDLGDTIGRDRNIFFTRLPWDGDDCDCNGALDACEVFSGAAGDCDGDGILAPAKSQIAWESSNV